MADSERGEYYHLLKHQVVDVVQDGGIQENSRTTFRTRFLFLLPAAVAVAMVVGVLFYGNLMESFDPKWSMEGSESNIKFFSIGDWGRAGNFNQSLLASQMGAVGEAFHPQFVTAVGDNFYDEGLVSAQDPFFEKSFTHVYNASSLQVPWVAALGNHDYYGNVSAQFDPELTRKDWRWSCVRSGPICPIEQKELCNSLVKIIYFDTVPMVKEYRHKKHRQLDWSGINVTDFKALEIKQLQELSAELQASKARWNIVIGHHPIFSYGEHGNTPELVEQLKPILEEYAVDIYMNGHDHDMQHIKRVDSPVHYFTSGGGSKAFEKMAPITSNGLNFFWEGQGFAALSVQWDTLTVDYFGVEGQVMYTYQLTK